MTSCLIKKTTSAGTTYFYVRLKYKDPHTLKWKSKDMKTGLPDNGRNKKRAKAMMEAFAKEYAYLEEIAFLKNKMDPNITLCEFLDFWIEEKRCSIEKNTADTYKWRIATIKRYFEPRPIPLRNVRPKDLQDFYNYSLMYGKVSQKDQSLGPLSVRTVRSCKSILQEALDNAVLRELIPVNPVYGTKVSNKRNKEFSEELLFLEEDEIRGMLLFLEEHYPYLVPIAFVGVYYGMRREEILGLKWSAINFQKRTVAVRHTVTGNTTIYRRDKTKTSAGYRTLLLFPTAASCFEKVSSEQERNREFFGNTYQDTMDYVFTYEEGRPYRPDYISHKFAKAMDEFGRPEITLHKLRHTCVSLLFDKGWDVKKIQYWIGDNDAATVMNIYAHYIKHKSNVAENDLIEMTEAVADLFA